MSAIRKCRGCGADVPINAPFGHCPKCLLDLGFGPMPDGAADDFADQSPGGRTFGDYELVDQIGRGGMGIVYKARQTRLNRLVALKMISAGEFASPMLVQRFHREAEAAANLHHPNIVPIYEIGELRGQHFFSMQLIEGVGLDRHIGRTGFLRGVSETDARTAIRARQEDIARILAKVARAVDYAHQHGVLHRDLKPSNIILDAHGEPHLTDFGVAKVMGHDSSELTASGAIMGTPSFMAPEQAAGDSKRISPAADIYSLGAVLYAMLTGSPPFRADTPVETLKQVIEQEPRHPSTLREGIDSDLATIAMKCLEKEPQRRYPSATALAEELDRWLRQEPIQARPIHAGERLWRWSRRNRAASAALAILLVGLSGSLLLLRQVSMERDAKQAVVRILIKSITQGVERFASPSQPNILLTAEELAALTGTDPRGASTRTRLSIGVLISRNPLETTVSFARFLPLVEQQMARRLGEAVRFDLKIYRDPAVARRDFLSGQVDLIEMDRMIPDEVNAANGGVVPLLRKTGPGYATLIITRPDTGITNLAGLRGRTLGLWDRRSVFSLFARAFLSGSGFCQSKLHCVYLLETPAFANARGVTHIEESPMSDHDRTGSTVPALLKREYDAVVCRLTQLNVLKEGKDWIRLGEFATTRSLWLGRAGLKPALAEAFSKSLCAMEPEEYSLLSDSADPIPSKTGEFEIVDAGFLAAFYETVRRAARFESCGAGDVSTSTNESIYRNAP